MSHYSFCIFLGDGKVPSVYAELRKEMSPFITLGSFYAEISVLSISPSTSSCDLPLSRA